MRTLVYNWDLVSNLVQRDIKIHYRRSVLGLLWTQVNALLSLAIFSFVFQQIVPLNIPNYPAYVFSGLLAWNWFSTSLNMASFSLSSSRDLVRKPQFPTEMIVVVSVTTNLVNFLLSLPALIGLLLINNILPTWSILLFPVLLLIQFAFTLGLALIISASNFFFHDVMHIVGILMTGWFYITPVFYRSTSNSSSYEFIFNLNPMNHLLNTYRQILVYATWPDFLGLFWLTVVALVVLGLGLLFFRRTKYNFVDLI